MRNAIPKSSDQRKRELALIHLAKKQLALDDETYLSLIRRFSAGRTESSAKLDDVERTDLIEHFRRSGVGKSRTVAGRGNDGREQAYKLRALWRSLYELGVANSPDDNALAAFVCRHTGREAMRWNNAADLRIAIESLKAWCKRVGYQPIRATKGPCQDRFEPCLINTQWARLIAFGVFKGEDAKLGTWLIEQGWRVIDPELLQIEDAQEAVHRLGKSLRRYARGRPEIEADDA
jgi:phage gp16-like protein